MSSAKFAATVKRIAAAVFMVAIASGTGWGVGVGKPDAAVGAFAARAGAQQPPQKEGPKAGKAVTLEVVDAADLSALPGAVVWVRGRGGLTHTWEGTTDDQGQYVVVPPDEATRRFDILVARPGYVPGHLSVISGMPNFRLSLDRAGD